MPFAIDTSGPIMRITFSGTFTNEELMELAQEADRIERSLHVAPHRMTDLRPITRAEITFRGMLAFVQERLRVTFPNSFKSAIVANDVVHYGFARMFEILNDHPQIVIGIFADDADAMRWLSEPGLEPNRERWAPRANAF